MSASFDVVIYHNPECGTSRNTLAMIRNAGIEPHVVEYLKTPPVRALLASLIERMGVTVQYLLREKGTLYAQLGLGDPSLEDQALFDVMMEHPPPNQPSDRCLAAGCESVPAVGGGARPAPSPTWRLCQGGRRARGGRGWPARREGLTHPSFL